MRFADFVAVDHVDLSIERGDFSVPGLQRCGKTTTMKMLTDSAAQRRRGATVRPGGRRPQSETRKRVGYMSQAFSCIPN